MYSHMYAYMCGRGKGVCNEVGTEAVLLSYLLQQSRLYVRGLDHLFVVAAYTAPAVLRDDDEEKNRGK